MHFEIFWGASAGGMRFYLASTHMLVRRRVRGLRPAKTATSGFEVLGFGFWCIFLWGKCG